MFKYYLYIFISCGIFSAIFTPLMRKAARRGHFLDKPSARKVHRKNIPTLGGIAIFVSFIIGLVFIFNLDGFLSNSGLLGLVFGSSLIVVLGIYDDIKGIPAITKLAIQIIAASVVYYFGFRITEISGLFVEKISLGYASYFVTIAWIVVIINAINLLDGLDGLACGVTAIIGVFLFITSLQDGNLAVSLLAAALVGSCIGFLPYNFHPATIFMGDTGSTFLGLMVSLLAIRSYQKTTTFMAILVPIIFLMVPLLDTALSVIRRLIEKKPIFKADKEHIHHKMLRERSQPKAVLSLYMATFSFGLIALGLKGLKGIYTLIALILVAIVTFIWVKNSGLIDWKRN